MIWNTECRDMTRKAYILLRKSQSNRQIAKVLPYKWEGDVKMNLGVT